MTDFNGAKQQADDDLTWLARNVHRWIDGDYLIRVSKICYTFRERCEGETVLLNWYTRDQWLTRRAELQNKPSFVDHPDAKCLVQDNAGHWHKNVITDKVFPGSHFWRTDFDRHQHNEFTLICKGELLGDWRDTLERRPQAAKLEPSSDDWYKRGELPPVGTECEMFLDGGWWQVLVIGQSRHGHPVTQDLLGVISECINCKFRPLQTERERIASELVDVMMAVPVSDRKTASESYMSMALAIYDHLHPESKS